MEVQIKMTGVTSLVMHNGRLIDPLDPITQELAKLTSKRQKTTQDHEEIADVEWRGSLYWDPEMGAIIPTANIRRMFKDAGGEWKLATKTVKALQPLELAVPLDHDGPKTVAALAKRPEFRWRTNAKLTGGKSVMRTRPIFRRWGLTVNFELDENELSLDNLARIVERAGRLYGLGDANRIGYGRFTAEIRAA